MSTVVIPLPANAIAAAWLVYRRHQHDPLTEVCPVDGCTECEPFRLARATLALGGQLVPAWDPIAEMRRQQLWLASLKDR